MGKHTLVVDYGIGNLRSVYRAFEHCGAEVEISDDPRRICHADRVVLPGVGAIGVCLDELSRRGLIDALKRFADLDRPFLGICVGMQLMLERSYEFGQHECLGWIGGDVVPIPAKDRDHEPHKIPHIAWSSLEPSGGHVGWRGTILEGIDPGSSVYFVHSFAADPKDATLRLADTMYGGLNICAAVAKGSFSGTQFHPEKSGPVGLRIIRNFISR
jgi:glutamine amidotransferase